MELMNKELNLEWAKPKAKNLKDNDCRIARDYVKISSLHKQINDAKILIKGSIAERKHITYQKQLIEKNIILKYLIEQKNKMVEKAKIRRQKRNATKQNGK